MHVCRANKPSQHGTATCRRSGVRSGGAEATVAMASSPEFPRGTRRLYFEGGESRRLGGRRKSLAELDFLRRPETPAAAKNCSDCYNFA